MFEIGWTEMLVIAVVMIVVVGPKDLPKMLRTFGKTAGKLRTMAGDFQKQFNEALREAELDDVKKSVQDLKNLNPASEIRKHINPFEKAAADVRSGIDKAMNTGNPTVGSIPTPTPSPAAQPAEPLKNGATAMPEALQSPAASAQPAASTAATPGAGAGEAAAAAAAGVSSPAPNPVGAAKTSTSTRPAPKANSAAKTEAKPAAAAAKAPKASAAKPATARPAKKAAAAPRKKTGPAS